MPSGIIIKSASHEVSDEVRDANVKAVIESAGYEVPEPEPPAEPKREDFKTEEQFEAAHVEWQDTEEKKAEEAEEEAPAPRKSRKTRAIERATSELRTKVAELEAKLAAKGESIVVEPPKEKQAPKRTDFASDDDFLNARVAWEVEQTLKQKAVTDAQAAQRAEDEQIIRAYGAQVEEAKEKYEDWDEVVGQSEINIGTSAQLAILELENAAEVVYYLGRHPAFATKLSEMRPNSAVMEVGRLSAKLLTGAPAQGEANGERETKPRPKVPAPVRTVNTGATSANPTFAEISARPNYPGKAKDLRRAEYASKA